MDRITLMTEGTRKLSLKRSMGKKARAMIQGAKVQGVVPVVSASASEAPVGSGESAKTRGAALLQVGHLGRPVWRDLGEFIVRR